MLVSASLCAVYSSSTAHGRQLSQAEVAPVACPAVSLLSKSAHAFGAVSLGVSIMPVAKVPTTRSRTMKIYVPGKAVAAGGGVVVREVLNKSGRTKMDSSSDRLFYALPRLVKHVDDKFLEQLTELYRQKIPENAVILDLMSSWLSHLPDIKYSKVIGHGMNEAELNRNDVLDEHFVSDLNEDPSLALPTASVDAVLCACAVQYLQNPEKVFAEIHRVLKPGGIVIMSFSTRMFFQKAIRAWRDGTNYSRVQLVKQYVTCVTGYTTPEHYTEVKIDEEWHPGKRRSLSPMSRLRRLFAKATPMEPFNAVIAYKGFKPQ